MKRVKGAFVVSAHILLVFGVANAQVLDLHGPARGRMRLQVAFVTAPCLAIPRLYRILHAKGEWIGSTCLRPLRSE